LASIETSSLLGPPDLEVKTKKKRKRLMSNNLIRKGLAIGASVSLALAGLVGFAAPAQAAGSVYLVPAEGTSYTTLLDQGFTLAGSANSAALQGGDRFKFKVTDPDGKLDATSSNISSGVGTTYSTTLNVIRTTEDAWRNASSLAKPAGQTYWVGDAGVATAGASYWLGLKASAAAIAAGVPFSVTVEAWMDFNSMNGVIDASLNEQASEVRTITFVPASGVTASLTVNPYAVGDTGTVSRVSFTPELNGEQLSGADADMNSAFTASLTNSRNARSHADTVAVWDATNKQIVFTNNLPTVASVNVSGDTGRLQLDKTANAAQTNILTGDTVRITGASATSLNADRTVITGWSSDGVTALGPNLAASGTVAGESTTVQIIIGDNAYSVRPFYKGAALAAAASSTVTATTATTASTTATADANQFVDNRSATSLTVQVRSTAKTAKATYKATTAALAPVAGAAVRASVTVTGATGVKVNGTAVTTGSIVSATTDASGSVELTVDVTTAVAGNSVELSVTTGGVAGTTETILFSWNTATFSIVDLGDARSAGNFTKARAATKGGSHVFNLSVHDQFMQPLAGDHRILATLSDRTVAVLPVVLASGRGSLTVSDSQLNANPVDVDLKVQRLVSGTWTDGITASNTAVVVDDIKVHFYDQTDIINTTSVAADLTQVRSVGKTVARSGATSAVEAYDPDGATAVRVKATVNSASTGALKPGALVTISGPSDVLFAASSALETTAFGSLSFVSLDGNVDAYLYSNKVQKDTVITVSAGGVSKTVKVSFTASTSAADIDAVNITAVKSIRAGRTTTLTIAIVDEFGNVVIPGTAQNVLVTSSGSGYLTSYPATLPNGQAQITLVTGSGDFGASTISVTAAGADNSLTTTTDNEAATAAIWVGPVANAFAGVKDGRVKIEAYRAKGKTVRVFVGNTRVASFVSDKANFSKSVKVKSGTRNVRVVIVGPGSDFRGAIVVK
jgi:hypothetical protein